jgi:thiol:disulfide interchange protein
MIDCSDCGDEIVSELRQQPGVYQATFDRSHAEIVVLASPSFDVFTAARKLAAARGFNAILGEGHGAYVENPTFPANADVQSVAQGTDVASLDALVAKGKVTVIDFSAGWCGPCRQVDRHMAEVLAKRTDIAYRRLDVGDWDSPLARRYLKSVGQLPYVIVYDAKGARIKELSGLDLAGLDAALAATTTTTPAR